ncbi:Zinc finger GIS2 [Gossypium arboreum]|uniref:Zinc finger GIS2 n=1 Tax=Gossypium arboreum TaxID=29729 RepID=A0A0B0N4X8_GOSAR|nr:Zinc finger GIS2 [Gossypium arboreum]
MSFNRSRSLLRGKIFRSIDRVLYRDSPYCRDRRNNRFRQCEKKALHFAAEGNNGSVPKFNTSMLLEYCGRHVHLSVSLATPYFGYNRVGVEVVLLEFFSHIAAECNSITMCWNCKEPGHLPGQCPSEPVCNMCGKMGHLARDCLNPRLPAPDARLCNKCYKAGHFATDCTNEKACNNCRKTGHLARDCPNEPVCNICNISGHVARQCAKSKLSSDMGGRFRDIFCRNCGQPGHISQDGVSIVICNNCGGRGHLHYECPSARMYDRSGVRRY